MTTVFTPHRGSRPLPTRLRGASTSCFEKLLPWKHLVSGDEYYKISRRSLRRPSKIVFGGPTSWWMMMQFKHGQLYRNSIRLLLVLVATASIAAAAVSTLSAVDHRVAPSSLSASSSHLARRIPSAPSTTVATAATTDLAVSSQTRDEGGVLHTTAAVSRKIFNSEEMPKSANKVTMTKCEARRQLVTSSINERREDCANVLPLDIVEGRQGWLVGMHVDRGPSTMAALAKAREDGGGTLRGGVYHDPLSIG